MNWTSQKCISKYILQDEGAYHRVEGVLKQIDTLDDPSVELGWCWLHLVAIKTTNAQKEYSFF